MSKNGTKFWIFHEENPDVYWELKRLAEQLRERGHRTYGMKGLFEVLRWHRDLQTVGNEFKMCNTYTAWYARLLMKNEPDLYMFFRLRASKADQDPAFRRPDLIAKSLSEMRKDER